MSRSYLLRGMQLRWKSSCALVKNVEEELQSQQLLHKNHPGIVKSRLPNAPKWLTSAVRTILKGYPVPKAQIKKNAEKLAAHLHGRHKPLEQDELEEKMKITRTRVSPTLKSNDTDPLMTKRGKKLFKQLVHNWQPIDYNESNSIMYLLARSVQNYTVLHKILSEIKDREPEFKPYTLLDYGSGVGTVLWAANDIWGKTLQQHVCIDISNDMHNLSEKLLRMSNLRMKGVFYRTHLPAAPKPTYDIVTSAYTLFELPNAMARLETLAKLWDKTERYLVLVEHGTRAGFNVLNEARDFILNYAQEKSQQKKSVHVSAPCPHNLSCPRHSNDTTPCNFPINYYPLPIFNGSRTHDELYSYLVLQKGNLKTDNDHWPRIVRPVLKRSRHVVCRLCTSNGELEEQIFTKFKNGRNVYRCARSSEWGDRLPVTITEVPADENDAEKPKSDEEEREPTCNENNQTTETDSSKDKS